MADAVCPILTLKRKTLVSMDQDPPPTTLPDDVWLEIFSCLPVKTLMRFRCVSKSWHAVISCGRTGSGKTLPSPMCGLFHRNTGAKIFTALTSTAYVNRASIDTHLTFMTTSSLILPDFDIRDCCNGLLLLTDSSDFLYVCNPATKRWTKISKPPSEYAMLLLAFDPLCSMQFRIISFRYAGCMVVDIYSSKTGEWREIQGFGMLTSHLCHSRFVFLDGTFYVLEADYDRDIEYGCTSAVDADGMALRRIPHPNVPVNAIPSSLLGRSGGRLHYAMILDEELLVWALEGSKYVLKHRNSVRAIVNKSPGGEASPAYVAVLAIHPDLDVIFLKLAHNKLFSYHFPSSELVEICRFEVGRPCFPYSPCYVDDLQTSVVNV